MNAIAYLAFFTLWMSTHAADALKEQPQPVCRMEHHWKDHPVLCYWLRRLEKNKSEALLDLQHQIHPTYIVDLATTADHHDDAHAHEIISATTGRRNLRSNSSVHSSEQGFFSNRESLSPTMKNKLPVVVAHGMGDSCFNSGIQHLTETMSTWLNGTYVVCIPTGSTQAEDTQNGYFLSMQDNLDVLAKAVRGDTQLRNGFHAVGLSQGCNLLRGYIALHNDPPVHTFISINGVNAGVGAVPHCIPKTTDRNQQYSMNASAFSLCDLLMEQASHRAYTEFAQRHSFQVRKYWLPLPMK